MFFETSNFNQNIGSWVVSNVRDMRQIIHHASVFNHDIGSWEVSSVTIMTRVFCGAGEFNQHIGSWVVSGVTGMEGMFIGSAGEFNRNIGLWKKSTKNGGNGQPKGQQNREQPRQYRNQGIEMVVVSSIGTSQKILNFLMNATVARYFSMVLAMTCVVSSPDLLIATRGN
jgi:hypothetical protein